MLTAGVVNLTAIQSWWGLQDLVKSIQQIVTILISYLHENKARMQNLKNICSLLPNKSARTEATLDKCSCKCDGSWKTFSNMHTSELSV